MTFHDPNLARLVNGPRKKDHKREGLIISHFPLVHKLAWQVNGRMSSLIDVDDLTQIGMIALVEAARKYEDRGHGFSNYAKLRIRGAMIDQLRKISNLSRSAMKFRKKFRSAKEKLSQSLGREPNESELCKAMGMTPECFRAVLDHSDLIDLKSMDEVYSDQNICFEDQSEKADISLERSQFQETLAEAISSLPPKESMVLQLYFIEEMVLGEIGQTMKIGAARVCQIKKAAIAKLRERMLEKG